MRGKFLILELFRGLAAILVVLFHIDKFYFRKANYWPSDFAGHVFLVGHSGVQFFFVLSGFIMIWAHFDDLGQPARIRPFVVKRFIRIYPLVWLTVPIVAAMFAIGREAPEPALILQSLLLVGTYPVDAINFPTWTLWHENVFYVVCVVMIARPRLGLVVLGAWCAACAAAYAIAPGDGQPYPLRFVNVLFAMGVGAAFYLRHRTVPLPAVVLALGLAGFLACGLSDEEFGVVPAREHLIYGVTATMMVLGAVELERSGFTAPAWFAWFGNLSYPLYLTHAISLAIMAEIYLRAGAPAWLPAQVAGWLMFVVCMVAAVATHLLYERPVTRWLRQRLLPRKGPADAASAAPASG